MTFARLTSVERHVLYMLLMDASASVAEIARIVGSKPHTVRYALRKFSEGGLIARRIMVDVLRLGYSRHGIFISLTADGQSRRDEIAKFLVRYPRTSVVLKVGGEYDFFVGLVVRNPNELTAFYQSISVEFGSLFQRKDIAISMRHSVFGEKSLVSNPKHYRECTYAVSDEVVELTDDEHLLLYALSRLPNPNNSQIGRELGVPVSTIDYRIAKLKRVGVICGDMHEIRGELAGFNNYLVLVSMKGLSRETHESFYAFVRRHPHVPHFSHEVGAWDYMLGVAAPKPGDLNELVELIYRTFGEGVSQIKSFPMFRALKVSDYPFNPSNVALATAVGS